jgi:WD40 repeat protein
MTARCSPREFVRRTLTIESTLTIAALASLLLLGKGSAALGAELAFAQVLTHDGQVGGAALSPDGRYATTWSPRLIRFWDLRTGNIIAEDSSRSAAGCGSDKPEGAWPSPDGALLAIRCDGLVLIDTRMPAVVARLGGGYYTTAVAFDRSSRRLVRVFNLLDGKSYKTTSKFPHVVEVYDLADYYDPSWFGSLMRDWFGYDRNEPDQTSTIEYAWGDWPKATVFVPGQDQLLLQSEHGVERRAFEGQLLTRGDEADSAGNAWVCDSTHATFVTRKQDSTLARIYSLLTQTKRPKCRVTRDGQRAFMLQRSELSAWDVESGTELWNYGDETLAYALDISPDGKQVAIADRDGRAALLSAEGELLARGSIPPVIARQAGSSHLSCSSSLDVGVTMSADGQTVAITVCASVFILRVR